MDQQERRQKSDRKGALPGFKMFDLLSPHVGLTFDEETRMKSRVGGAMTLIFIFISSLFVVIYFRKVIIGSEVGQISHDQQLFYGADQLNDSLDISPHKFRIGFTQAN